ncbi:glycosyltransferase family 2 protein [Floccifex sp.]|uniref:glycosyltransferase family 2 protein n=1 Tax=Floccifex sp. TaxID=2815810 RepID=UPI0029FF344F|nr:glycosyltransferase [Floccifex sp.]MDD7281953.1 glycosyltransferase family 2 protein [Erysipelotrichaceae bacterium]MDY2957848.1 glycosyltransferase family 2 protein [Floccifex sp.]
MNNPIVSVIVPVYNSIKYLNTAVDSILSQDFASFELLLVDDGSSDGSEHLCDEIAQKDSRVKVIHKENGGMCSARNVGLKQAKGKYILFCDNDDIYLPHLMRDNVALAEENTADIVKYSRLRVHIDNGNKTEEKYIYQYEPCVLSGEDIYAKYSIQRNISSGVWCNLYRKDIILEHNIFFPEDFRFGYEDMYFNIEYYKYVNKVVLNPKVYYHWIQRDNHSTTKKFSENFIYALEVCLEKEWSFIKETDIVEQYKGTWEDILTNYYVFGYYLALQNPKAPYTKKQKIEKLKKFRNQECFNVISKESMKALKKLNFKRYLILNLFLKNYHSLNMLIMDFYSKHVSKIV